MSVAVLLALVAVGALEGWLISLIAREVIAGVRERLRRRDVVRRSAADQEMQAMHAAQQLSLMAWRARHEIYDIARQGHATRFQHPARRN